MDYQSIKEFTQRLISNHTYDGLISIKEKEYQSQVCYHFEIDVYYTPVTVRPIPKESIIHLMHFEYLDSNLITEYRKLQLYEQLYNSLLIWAIQKSIENKEKLDKWGRH